MVPSAIDRRDTDGGRERAVDARSQTRAPILQPRRARELKLNRNDASHPDYTHVIRMSMNGAGFGSTIVLKLTGVTYRQLDYWARTGLVGSSIRQAAGRGSRRV